MLLDTNVYSALDAGKSSARLALKQHDTIQLPIVVVGELRYGFAFGAREEENNNRLNLFLAQDMVDVLLLNENTAAIYANLASLCRKKGRALSNNDLWIAALAQQQDTRLVTYDKDFQVFQEYLGDNLIVLED